VSLEEEAASSDGDCRKIEGCPGGSKNKEELSELRKTPSLRCEEGDVRQVELAKGRQKWHGGLTAWLPILISVVSLIVSLDVFYHDRQSHEKERLTTLVQELVNVRERMSVLTLQYEEKAPNLSVELGQPLIEEAIPLLDVVHANSSFDKTVIAESLIENHQPGRAGLIAEKAELEAANLLEKVLAARWHAVAYFNQGNVNAFEDGRRAYLRATKSVDAAVGVDSVIKGQYQLETEQFWIASELRIRNCPGTKEQMHRLEFYLGDVPKAQAGVFEKNAQRVRDVVANNCP
jgi:hypothetical protein